MRKAGTARIAVLAIVAACGVEMMANSVSKGGARTTFIPEVGKAPSIDGRIEEDEWRDAAAVSAFTRFKEWAEPQTSVLSMTDRKKLYFAFKCLLMSPLATPAKHIAGDSQEIFGNESVELFLQPDLASQVYYHIAFAPDGSRYSARCEPKAGSDGRDASWNPAMEVATGGGKDFWTVEVAIPLESFGSAFVPGSEWGLNFGRNSMSPGRISSSWTGQSYFNDFRQFGRAAIGTAATVDFMIDKTANSSSGLHLTLRNHLSKEIECKVVLADAVNASSKDCVISPKSSCDVSVRLLSPGRGVRLTIDGGGFNFQSSAPQAFTIMPALFYCRRGAESMDVKLRNLPCGDAKVDWSLWGSGTEKSLADGSVFPGDREFRVGLKSLAPGRYRLSAKVSSPAGDALTRHDAVFIIHEPFAKLSLPEEQKFQLSGPTILMNGAPFFPFMRTGSGGGKSSPLAEDSFNVGTGNMSNAPAIGACGLPCSLKRDSKGVRYELPSEAKTIAAIDAFFKAAPTKAPIYRRLQYEAQIPLTHRQDDGSLTSVDPFEEYQRIFKHIKTLSPETLVSIQTDNFGALEGFLPCADIIEIASGESSYAINLIQNLPRDLKEARRVAGSKPLVWWIGASVPNPQSRTAEMLKAASYLVMMLGGNGISFHMGHGGVPVDMTRLWSVFKGLERELESLYPIVINGKPMELPPLDASGSGLELIARRNGDGLYIVAVNTNPSLIKVRLPLPGECVAKKGGRVEVLFESRSIQVGKDGFSDEFAPYEAHVYRVH